MNILFTVVHRIVTFIVFLSLAASAFAGGRTEEPPGEAYLPGDAAAAERLEALGFVLPERPLPVPDLGFDSLSGGPVYLIESKGSLVMLNFWASWCPPCRAEMPSMQRLWEDLEEENFLLYAVSVGERRETAAAFIEEEGYTFPVLLDPAGVGAEIFQVQGIPVTWLIGPDGLILGRYVGSREWDTEEIIDLFEDIIDENK